MREESGNIAGIREQLITTDKGAVKQCIRNVVTVFENDPKFKGAIRYNMMTDRNDIVKGLGWYRESTALRKIRYRILCINYLSFQRFTSALQRNH